MVDVARFSAKLYGGSGTVIKSAPFPGYEISEFPTLFVATTFA